MNGGINSAEPPAENDDSFFARLIGWPVDHRVLSIPRSDCNPGITARMSARFLCPVVLAVLLRWGRTDRALSQSHLERRRTPLPPDPYPERAQAVSSRRTGGIR